ncbi:hypothetical protein BCR43DRAFT_528000 [Syncephalastrum racemosum]|uniref:Uncharacterized protein n=1 Tax=Syncephalastrum racemosum TaxID=13706 RepID=A0A1X2GZU3_SYNRA|nr:hypothetical protein BCR43DRAFT_528000 [Syncephalastrum racemosum]
MSCRKVKSRTMASTVSFGRPLYLLPGMAASHELLCFGEGQSPTGRLDFMALYSTGSGRHITSLRPVCLRCLYNCCHCFRVLLRGTRRTQEGSLSQGLCGMQQTSGSLPSYTKPSFLGLDEVVLISRVGASCDGNFPREARLGAPHVGCWHPFS